MSKYTSRTATRAIAAFEKIEAKFGKASDAYKKACAGSSVAKLTAKHTALQTVGRELRVAYVVMNKACAADTAEHFETAEGGCHERRQRSRQQSTRS